MNVKNKMKQKKNAKQLDRSHLVLLFFEHLKLEHGSAMLIGFVVQSSIECEVVLSHSDWEFRTSHLLRMQLYRLQVNCNKKAIS